MSSGVEPLDTWLAEAEPLGLDTAYTSTHGRMGGKNIVYVRDFTSNTIYTVIIVLVIVIIIIVTVVMLTL